MTSTAPTSFSSATADDLATVDDKGNLTKQRLKDYAGAHAIYKRRWEDDADDRYNRRCERGLVEGEPPFIQQELDDAGESDRANVNWMTARARSEQAKTPFLDLTTSVPQMALPELAFGAFQEEQAYEYRMSIAEGWHKLHNEVWEDFEEERLSLVSHTVDDGIGVAHCSHLYGWQFEGCGRDEILFRRGMKPRESACQDYFRLRDYDEEELSAWIRNPKAARAVGYSVNQIQDAMKACSDGSAASTQDYLDEIEGNILGVSHRHNKRIRLFHYRYTEFDGSVKEVIGRTDGQGDFLYKGKVALKEMRDALVIFKLGIGNQRIEGVNGLLRRIFATEQTINQAINHALDYFRQSMSMVIQVENANQTAKMADVRFGYRTELPAGIKLVEHQMPNIGQNAIPFVGFMSQLEQNNTGLYQQRAVTPDNQARTLGEVQQQAMLDAQLTIAAISLFYKAWDKLQNLELRRLQNRRYPDNAPGAKERRWFFDYIKARKVPLEAFYKVVRMAPQKAVGAGSPAVRLQSLQQLMPIAAQLGPFAQADCQRQMVAALGGNDLARQWVPDINTVQTSQQQINAEQENAFFQLGVQQLVHPDDNHFVHATAHDGPMMRMLQASQAGQLPATPEISKALGAFLAHQPGHLQPLANDKAREPAVKVLNQHFNMIRQLEQRITGAVQAQMRQQAQQQEAAAQAAQQGGGGGAQPNPSVVAAAQKAQISLQTQSALAQQKLAFANAKAQQTMQTRAQKTAQDLHLKDARTAHDLLASQEESPVPAVTQDDRTPIPAPYLPPPPGEPSLPLPATNGVYPLPAG